MENKSWPLTDVQKEVIDRRRASGKPEVSDRPVTVFELMAAEQIVRTRKLIEMLSI